MEFSQRSQQAKWITFVGALTNFIFALIKVFFGWLGHSHALVADGVHSFSDLLTDGLVFFASHVGSQSADTDHPYGHQRIETAATLILALMLAIAGSGIIYGAVNELLHPSFHKPLLIVLIVALFSIIANEILFHTTLKVGKRINSNLLIANAWHHRSDAASSFVVFVGVAMAVWGWYYFDAIAAIVVGVMVIRMGWQLGWSSVRELVDTGVGSELLREFAAAISQVPGVVELHQLRTRSMGGHIFLDVHVMVAPRISVSEGHFIAHSVRQTLQLQHQAIADVTVHIDPENDELYGGSATLPTRHELTQFIDQLCHELPGGDQMHSILLHYLADKIEVEISLPKSFTQVQDIEKIYNNCILQHSAVSRVKINFV